MRRPKAGERQVTAELSKLYTVPQPRTVELVARGGGDARDRIRTCDLRLRRPTLYPAELRAQVYPPVKDL
jgi:hypothetical protein